MLIRQPCFPFSCDVLKCFSPHSPSYSTPNPASQGISFIRFIHYCFFLFTFSPEHCSFNSSAIVFLLLCAQQFQLLPLKMLTWTEALSVCYILVLHCFFFLSLLASPLQSNAIQYNSPAKHPTCNVKLLLTLHHRGADWTLR